MSRVAVVTGANRGIGLELVRQLADRGDLVYLGSRDLARGESAAASLAESSARGDAAPEIRVAQLDVADPGSVAAFADRLRQETGRVDVLVNNAGIHYDTGQRATEPDFAVVEEALATNLVGAWRLTVALLPLLRPVARVVNVSSGSGSFGETGGGAGTPAYAVSKAALDMLTVKLAAELRGQALVNAVCPGWVATDMGGSGGRPVAQGAASVLYAADLPDDGPTGGFFRDGSPIPW